MAVIFTDVDMQEACCSCKDDEVKYCHFYNVCKRRDTIKINFKPDSCPLKSTDDMMSEVEELKPTNPNFRHYEGETRAINNALEVLQKYCGGENK